MRNVSLRGFAQNGMLFLVQKDYVLRWIILIVKNMVKSYKVAIKTLCIFIKKTRTVCFGKSLKNAEPHGIMILLNSRLILVKFVNRQISHAEAVNAAAEAENL